MSCRKHTPREEVGTGLFCLFIETNDWTLRVVRTARDLPYSFHVGDELGVLLSGNRPARAADAA